MEDITQNKKYFAIVSVVAVIIVITAAVFLWFFFYKGGTVGNKNLTDKNVSSEKSILSGFSCDLDGDAAYLGEAVKKPEIGYCTCIKDEAVEESCKKSVTDIVSYNNAIDNYDISICENIFDPAIKEACLNIVKSGIDYLEKTDPGYLAEKYMDSHDTGKAIELLERLIQQNPNEITNLIFLSLSYAEKGLEEQASGRTQGVYVEKALATISKAKTIDPNNSEIYRAEGYIYEVKPDLDLSIQSYDKAIELDPINISAYVGRGHVKNIYGILEEALKDFEKAASLDKGKRNIAIYQNLCRLQMNRSDLLSKAVENCQIAANAGSGDSVYKSEAYQMLSSVYVRQKDFSNAEANLLKAKALTPENDNLYVSFAKLELAQEKYPEAKAYAQKAINISSSKSTAYYLLAYSLYRQEKFDEAIAKAEKGLLLVDSDVSLLISDKPSVKKNLYYTLANIYNRKGDTANEEKYKKLGDDALNSD